MLSARAHMERYCGLSALKHLGLSIDYYLDHDENPPKILFHGAKLSPFGEGLTDKGFQSTNRLFLNCNQVRCPKTLSNRNVKQHDVPELNYKGELC